MLTIGKINIWRVVVRAATREAVGPFTLIRRY